jgi:DNA-directed RNA polymerase specialized sigma24 family protein
MSDVTKMLSAIENGEQTAADELLPLVYQELRKLVRLRFFAGLTLAEAARALGISSSTADNDWAYAKTWLQLEMSDSDEIEKNS